MSKTVYEIQKEMEDLSYQRFEYFVADLWTLDGWRTKVTGAKDEFGEDVIARRNLPFEIEILIQAKAHSEGNKVGKDLIDKAALPRGTEFDEMVVVTSNAFTRDAKNAAEFTGTKLVNGKQLATFVQKIDASALLEEYRTADEPTDPNVWNHTSTTAINNHVTDIKYIGPKRSEKLADIGIQTIGELADLKPDEIAELADKAEMPEKRFERWVKEAAYRKGKTDLVDTLVTDADLTLQDIDGIGPKFADELAKAGIDTVAELAIADPGEVAAKSTLGANQVRRWGRRARALTS